jgi:hypothetical protein
VTAHRGSPRLPLRRLYSISEFARAARMDRRRLRRLLEECGVELFPVGRRMSVPLSEIIAKLKPLWDSIRAYDALSDPDFAETD